MKARVFASFVCAVYAVCAHSLACKTGPEARDEETPSGAATGAASSSASAGQVTSAEEAWRRERPTSAPTRTPVLPTFETAKLANGLTLLVATVDAMPVVAFRLVTQGGIASDPKGRGGLTSLTYAMLGEGTKDLDALAFSDAVADLGASFGAACDRDHGAVAINGLSRNSDAMLRLMADAVRNPRLAKEDFERLKKLRLASLEERRGSPQGLAFDAVPKLLYGQAHPYGHPTEGTLRTVAGLDLGAVRAQHARAFAPASSTLIATGKISLAEAKALAEKHFGDWRARPAARVKISAVSPQKRKNIVVIGKEGAPQTMIVVGRPIFPKGHPDEIPMTVLNEVFGGSFSSRLNMNLREDKGYSYGASSMAVFRSGAGAFLATSAVRADASAPSLREFFREMDDIITRPPTEDEVERAKSGLVRSLPGSFETTSAIAGAAAALFVYGLPLDYYSTLAPRYEAVTRDQIVSIAKKHLVAERMSVLLVGDPARITADVPPLGLGKVQIQAPE